MTSLAAPKVSTPRAAGGPPERRGVARDGVKLMVAGQEEDAVRHTTFSHIGDALVPGDLLVINVSATGPASLEGRAEDGSPIRLHISSPLGGNLWTVEPRQPVGVGSERILDFAGGVISLAGGASAVLFAADSRSPRLWVAELQGVKDLGRYLERHGQPVRYSHTDNRWPLDDYQSVYANQPGSVEMPSAGRPFTTGLITSLMAAGVLFAPLVLHAGLASFEAGERPDAERYRVPEATAALVNHVRGEGGRVVAVGTTSVRALETVTDSRGQVHPGNGLTELVVTPQRGVRAVDGLITGWHDAGASHLDLVSAVAGADLLDECYHEARRHGYLWHEFGDSLLVMASRRQTSDGSGNQRSDSADAGSGDDSSPPV
ncbi:MAG: S-adenosylmethionine:tRNA ribosyltransferase-isomerase, partial [Acidimicrobiia bacterium]